MVISWPAVLFTETTLGRFLQAIELYILIVYNLTCTFYPPSPLLPTATQLKRSSSFRRLDNRTPGVNLNPSPAAQGVPGAVMLIGRNPYPPSGSSRLSYLSMVSQRLPSLLRRSPKRESGGERLWDQKSAETGRTRPLNIRTPDLGPRVEEFMDIQNWKLPFTMADAPSEPPLPPATTVVTGPNATKGEPVIVAPEDEIPVPDTAFSVYSLYAPSEYTSESAPLSNPAQSRSIESPVYGLDGIVGTNRMGRTSRVGSVTSIDELLRKQRELDKSIEALRLFSPGMSSTPTPENLTTTIPPNITRGDSVSVASVLSLSNFPEPPSISRRSSATIRPVLRRSQRQRAQRVERPGIAPVPPPIVIPPMDDEINGKLPQTVGGTGDTGRFNKFDSMGTQYDVTSFIGGEYGSCADCRPLYAECSCLDLSSPSGVVLTGLTSALKSSRLSDVPSVDERGQVTGTTNTKAKRPRPTIVTSARAPPSSAPSIYSGPATASSGLLYSQASTGQLSARSRLTPQRSASPATTLGVPSPVPVRPAVLRKPRGLPTLPSGPRTTVMGPRPAAGR